MEARYPIYATADLTVESQDGPHDRVVTDIKNALETWFDTQETAVR
jgi:hypothetical protein